MRIVSILLVLSLCSCKDFIPPTEYKVDGVYSGNDSTVLQIDKYGQKMFGKCVRVEQGSDQKVVFLDKELNQIGAHQYSFDYTIPLDFGIGDAEDIHQIRHMGKFDFKGNKLVVDYSVGECNGQMSQFHFEGWR